MPDGVTIGTAIVSYIEPHAGCERAFNRWYERDHFPAAVTAGAGAFAGGRWVATRRCKVARPAGTLLGDPRRGSYLAAAWVLPGMQPDWDAWVARQMPALAAPDRVFAGRDHLHTAVYRYVGEARAAGGPPAAAALDRCYPGVVAVAGPGVDVGRLVGPEVPVAVALERERVLLSTLDGVAPHVLALAFVDGDVLDVWRRAVAPALDPGVGFAGPFLRTVPGTDRYADEL